ncbi:TPA: tetratricopeptide repeat protein [Kluyvera georgiana]|nr:tetratricopeptide repeat protein [Kluyvera georgiana]
MNPEPTALHTIFLQVNELVKAERWAEAEVVLRQALASGSGPLFLWRQLYIAFRQQGQFTEATRVLEMIVQAAPGDMNARFDLSEMLLLQGTPYTPLLTSTKFNKTLL